jgi:hypothetical protein
MTWLLIRARASGPERWHSSAGAVHGELLVIILSHSLLAIVVFSRPDGGMARPRSASIVITRNDGGKIGADSA